MALKYARWIVLVLMAVALVTMVEAEGALIRTWAAGVASVLLVGLLEGLVHCVRTLSNRQARADKNVNRELAELYALYQKLVPKLAPEALLRFKRGGGIVSIRSPIKATLRTPYYMDQPIKPGAEPYLHAEPADCQICRDYFADRWVTVAIEPGEDKLKGVEATGIFVDEAQHITDGMVKSVLGEGNLSPSTGEAR
jgi:hypothetical protein